MQHQAPECLLSDCCTLIIPSRARDPEGNRPGKAGLSRRLTGLHEQMGEKQGEQAARSELSRGVDAGSQPLVESLKLVCAEVLLGRDECLSFDPLGAIRVRLRLVPEQEPAVVSDKDQRGQEEGVPHGDAFARSNGQRDDIAIAQSRPRLALDHRNLTESGPEIDAANPIGIALGFQQTHAPSPTPTDQTTCLSVDTEPHYSISASPRTRTTC